MADPKPQSPTDKDETTSLPDLGFDEPLGAAQGVVAFSNLDDYYFSGVRAYLYDVYTGYKYQCVEYARRYMLVRQHCIFGQCGPAAEIFAMTEVTHIETGETHPFIACKNAETTVRPEVGMVLIYPQTKKMPVGHVAIISYVDDTHVGIAEQNQESKSWQGKPYGRLQPLKKDAESGAWSIIETDVELDPCSGWLYIEGAAGKFLDPLPGVKPEILSTVCEETLQSKIYLEPKVHPTLKADATVVKKVMARFATPARTLPPKDLSGDSHCKDAGTERTKLVEQYVALLGDRFNAVKEPSEVHHHRDAAEEGPTFRRAGVARTPHWHSSYTANEPLAIGSMSDSHECFMVAERGVLSLVDGVTDAKSAEALARTFTMPVETVLAVAKQLHDAVSNRASSVLAADCLMGMLGLVHDSSSASYKLLHAELDSLHLLIDINACQDHHAEVHGLQNGWRQTTFGNDFHRAYRNHLRYRVGNHDANHPLTFLDFGSSAELKERYGFAFPTEAQRYQYDVERISHLFMAQTLQDFLKGKQKSVDDGELTEKSKPQWSVVVCRDAFDAVRPTADQKALELISNGSVLRVAWKCCPWWALFELAEKIPAAKALVDATCQQNVSVIMQPLWTHMASHPAFLPRLAVWAEAHDRAATDGIAVTKHVLPAATFGPAEDGQLPRCTYQVEKFNGPVDPKHDYIGQAKEGLPAPLEKTATAFYPAYQFVMAGGKRSCGCAIEGRAASNDTSVTIYDVVHPASNSYMPFLKLHELVDTDN